LTAQRGVDLLSSHGPLARSREADAFFAALDATSPNSLTACDGWTAHEVTAHLAAVAAEISRHLVPLVEGRPIPVTATFEEREPPFRALDDSTLRQRLEVEERAVRQALDRALTLDPDAVIPWTGRHMVVANFIPHLRNEFALHRWDIVGDDPVSYELLAQAELTEHAISVLGRLLLVRGIEHDPGHGADFDVRLWSAGAPDVRLRMVGGSGALELGDNEISEADVELDAAARTLVIWGRRPNPPQRVVSRLPAADLARLQALLSGY